MPPNMTSVGTDLYLALAPLTYDDAALGYPLAHYLSASGLILEDIALLVRAGADGDGWSAFADPQRCPEDFLYTLAQWAGVRYPRRMSADDLRAVIGPRAPGPWRGTRQALLASVRRYLTDDGTIYLEEFADGDPYKLRVFTYSFNTRDEEAIRHELHTNVPAGLIVLYEVRDGQTYNMVRARAANYTQLKAMYATYQDMHDARPISGG